MSDYLPSFIVEPVLRQARRFSERIGGEESPAGAPGSSFSLPAVPDLQRFYPSRFWNQSPLPTPIDRAEGLVGPPLNAAHIAEESTFRSIARNIQLWASQINNLDVEDDVLQEPVAQSIEEGESGILATTPPVLTTEPDSVHPDTGLTPFPPLPDIQGPASRSLPVLTRLQQPQRTSSETSLNPAHELSYRSRVIEHHAQGRSHSDPFAAVNTTEATSAMAQESPREEYEENAYVRGSDGTGLLPEDDGMKHLRQKISAVWAGPGTAQEKSRLVHALMMERYRSNQPVYTPSSAATPVSPPFRASSPLSLPSVRSEEAVFHLSQADLTPSFAPLDADAEPDGVTGEMPKPDLGCIHYKRNVKMQCAACERWYPCRICHDEKEGHQLPRRETKHMLCMLCKTPQRVAQICRMCNTQAAYYYCPICKLWNNDTNKSVYHCDDCGICRLGQGLGKDFFHCKTCAACMSIAAESTHRCIEKSTKCDCPICGEYMFTSSQPVTFMRCGHSIHETCYEEWCNTSYKCPICSKSIANMESQFRRLDRDIESQPMPEEYRQNRAYVFCNDCNSRSVVYYHWLGLKCAVCDSYNTAQLELLGAESPSIQERADRAQELGVGESGITASQVQTPTDSTTGPASRPNTGYTSPVTTSSNAGNGTPRSAIAIPARRDSPFHQPLRSPSRSARAVSPVVGSYFGTGQRPAATENRRGSYFSVLSFGTTNEDSASYNANHPRSPTQASSSSRGHPQSSRLSQSHLSPPSTSATIGSASNTLSHDTGPHEDDNDDDDMDFWGGQSPRSHDADIVDLDLEAEESSSSNSDEMDYEDDDEDDDPMDILIGHR